MPQPSATATSDAEHRAAAGGGGSRRRVEGGEQEHGGLEALADTAKKAIPISASTEPGGERARPRSLELALEAAGVLAASRRS